LNFLPENYAAAQLEMGFMDLDDRPANQCDQCRRSEREQPRGDPGGRPAQTGPRAKRGSGDGQRGK